MDDAHAFLRDLTLVLTVAALTTVLFQKIRQPVVLGYLLAGAIISPHTPTPLVADLKTVHTLSEVGVILLMFSLGLEFSLRKLVQVGPRAAFVAIIQSSLMVWLGFGVGRLFGWTSLESLFLGGAIAISSTTIIVKAFQEQDVKGPLTTLVFAILIVEDLIAILLLALLTPIASGITLSAGTLAATLLRLALFLAGTLVVGYLTVPRAIKAVVKLDRPETLLVAAVGVCFALSYLAQSVGYSVALGAFLAGSLVAESGHEKKIEHLVEPVRDMFAAIFFVSVGMLLEPKLIAEHWLEILVLVLVVIFGKLIGVGIGATLAGYHTKTSVQAGMSLAQIGEFSFIIASVGLALGAVGSFLYPVAVAVSAATTLTTPWLIRAAPRVARAVDHALPRPIQTTVAIYASWVERVTTSSTASNVIRRQVVLLVVDAVATGMIVVGTALGRPRAMGVLMTQFGLDRAVADSIVIAVAAAACLPFIIGLIRCTRGLGNALADRAVGPTPSAAEPPGSRRAIQLATYVGVLVVVGLPLVAITQPVLSSFPTAAVLVTILVLAALATWRVAGGLHDEVRAGAQMIVDTLEAALPAPGSAPQLPAGSAPQLPAGSAPHAPAAPYSPPPPERALRLEPSHFAVGKSLVDMDLRSRTGAVVLAVERDEQATIPAPREPMRAGDILALAGTRDAIEAATQLLRAGPEST